MRPEGTFVKVVADKPTARVSDVARARERALGVATRRLCIAVVQIERALIYGRTRRPRPSVPGIARARKRPVVVRARSMRVAVVQDQCALVHVCARNPGPGPTKIARAQE